jgi:uncharacterized protein YejL (UPF0352 family)
MPELTLDSPSEALLEEILEIDLEGQWLNLTTAVGQIKKNLLSYVTTGWLIKKIFHYRLWRGLAKSTHDFCDRFLGISSGYAKLLIKAAEVTINLAKIGFTDLPQCASQATVLIPFNQVDQYGDSPLAEKWQTVLDYAKTTAQRITTNVVKTVITPEEKQTVSKKFPKALWNQIEAAATKAGKSPAQYLADLVEADQEQEEAIDPIPQPRRQAWEQDLEALVQEQQPAATRCFGDTS